MCKRPVRCSFVKIDVEGTKLSVLNGTKDTLRNRGIALMEEVTENAPDAFALLRDNGFHLFHPNRCPVDDTRDMRDSSFCIKEPDERIKAFASKEQAA